MHISQTQLLVKSISHKFRSWDRGDLFLSFQVFFAQILRQGLIPLIQKDSFLRRRIARHMPPHAEKAIVTAAGSLSTALKYLVTIESDEVFRLFLRLEQHLGMSGCSAKYTVLDGLHIGSPLRYGFADLNIIVFWCVSDLFNQIHNNNPTNEKNRLTASNIQNRRHIREPIVPSTVEDVYSRDISNMNGEAMSDMPAIVKTTVEDEHSIIT